MNDDSLLHEVRGTVAVLTLNRPRVGNAIDLALSRRLMEAAIACDRDESVRAVLLRSNGKLFCAGGDVSTFSGSETERLPKLLSEETAYLHAAVARLARMDKPLITAVQGFAAGAGFSLAMLGDLVIAGEAAQFTLAYTGIGLTPDGGASWLLPRLVGLRRAQQMILLNTRLDSATALAEGLVTEVVADEALRERATALAEQLAAGPSKAFGRVRELLLGSFAEPLECHLERESRHISASSATQDGREGIAAFLDKRKATFQGL